MTATGLAVGLPVAALGLALVAANDFSSDVALIGSVPNTFATIPVVLGYLGVVVLWDAAGDTPLRRRVGAPSGRMALTNYLMQTVIGIVVLRGLFDRGDLSRSGIVGVHPGGVGPPALVVAGLAGPLPLRPRRVALEGGHLPPLATNQILRSRP